MSCDKAARTNRVAVWQVDSGGFKEPCVRWGPEFRRKRGNMGTDITRPVENYKNICYSMDGGSDAAFCFCVSVCKDAVTCSHCCNKNTGVSGSDYVIYRSAIFSSINAAFFS